LLKLAISPRNSKTDTRSTISTGRLCNSIWNSKYTRIALFELGTVSRHPRVPGSKQNFFRLLRTIFKRFSTVNSWNKPIWVYEKLGTGGPFGPCFQSRVWGRSVFENRTSLGNVRCVAHRYFVDTVDTGRANRSTRNTCRIDSVTRHICLYARFPSPSAVAADARKSAADATKPVQMNGVANLNNTTRRSSRSVAKRRPNESTALGYYEFWAGGGGGRW